MAIKHQSKRKTTPIKKTSSSKALTAELTVKKEEPVKIKRSFKTRLKGIFKREKVARREPIVFPSVWELTRQTLSVIFHNKKLFFGITIIYGILNVALANQWATAQNVTTLQTEVKSAFSGHADSVGTSFSSFLTLGQTSNSTTNSPNGIYEFILLVIVSLAIIWAVRRIRDQKGKIRIRDAYYQGMFPLVTFILVIAVIGLQLVPIIAGSALYSTVNVNGIAVGQLQRGIFLFIFAVFTMLSLYWLSASIFGFYEITKPGATPRQALKQARYTVRQVRWILVRKVIYLPIALLIVGGIVMIPFILWITPLIQIVYFLMSIIAVPIVHVYLMNLYSVLERADEPAASE
jgi:hypothetical protein